MDKPKSLTTLQRRLLRAKGYWPRIAAETDVNHSTVGRIARGDTPNPSIGTISRLVAWFRANPMKSLPRRKPTGPKP
jgi:hypothetical protein